MLGSAMVAMTVSLASAQQSTNGWAPSTQPSQPMQFTEDFDQDPINGWYYSCQHAVVSARSGRALMTSGGGHAVWTDAGDVGDFTLEFRYG